MIPPWLSATIVPPDAGYVLIHQKFMAPGCPGYARSQVIAFGRAGIVDCDYEDCDCVEQRERCTAGDSDACGVLVDRADRAIQDWVRGERGKIDTATADDVIQDSRIKILTKLSTWDGTGLLCRWAEAVAWRCLMDQYRRRGKPAKFGLKQVSLELAKEVAAQGDSDDPPWTAEEAAVARQHLAAVLASSKPLQVRAFKMYYYEQMTQKEIAVLIGKKVRTVRNYLKSILAKVRVRLQKDQT